MIKRRSTLALLAAAGTAGVLAEARSSRASGADIKVETIAIIGTGEVGSTLGKRWAAMGHKIIYGSRTPEEARAQALVKQTGNGATISTDPGAAAKADLILLAVPWAAVKDVIPALGDVRGKILMDPTNAVKVTEGRFEAPPGMTTSDGEEIQGWAPTSSVVKVFNTLSVEIMADARNAGGPVSVPLAGADANAKARVASLVQSMGLEPVDVGGMYVARYLEGMARLRMSFRAKNRPNAFEFYLRPRRD
jgi:predicted dinucleotide-binding enzyme